MSRPATFLITGVSGFIGGYAVDFFQTMGGLAHPTVVPVSRAMLEDPVLLAQQVRVSDAIFHFAGANRGTDAEIYETNIDLAERIVNACHTFGATPHILFASSIYAADLDGGVENPQRSAAFGTSKKEAERIFNVWASQSGGRVTTFLLPHIFGEGAKPFYNSAIATLCHQLARGEKSEIRRDAEVELVYVRDVTERFYQAFVRGEVGTVRIRGERMRLVDVYGLLKGWTESRNHAINPHLSDPLRRALYATLCWHISNARD